MALPNRVYANARVLSPQGRLDHDNCEAFRAELAPHLDASAREQQTVVLDLSGLEYVSSAGLRCFMLASRQAKSQHGRIFVAALQPFLAVESAIKHRAAEHQLRAGGEQCLPQRVRIFDARLELQLVADDRHENSASSTAGVSTRSWKTCVAPAARSAATS